MWRSDNADDVNGRVEIAIPATDKMGEYRQIVANLKNLGAMLGFDIVNNDAGSSSEP